MSIRHMKKRYNNMTKIEEKLAIHYNMLNVKFDYNESVKSVIFLT